MPIDHVLYGVRDLDDAQRWLAEVHGLRSIGGGEHHEWGTGNRIVPLGPTQYLELIAVVEPSSQHPLARVLTAMTSEGDRPVGVCLRPDDLDATVARLGIEVTAAERANPDGAVLRWRMAGLAAALGPDRLPFFIAWDGADANPELAEQPATAVVERIEVGGAPEALHTWLGEGFPELAAVGGPPGVQRVVLRRGVELLELGPR